MSLISSVLLLMCYRQEMKTNELTKIVSEESPGGKDIKTSSVSIKIVKSGLLRGFYHCLIEGVFGYLKFRHQCPLPSGYARIFLYCLHT